MPIEKDPLTQKYNEKSVTSNEADSGNIVFLGGLLAKAVNFVTRSGTKNKSGDTTKAPTSNLRSTAHKDESFLSPEIGKLLNSNEKELAEASKFSSSEYKKIDGVEEEKTRMEIVTSKELPSDIEQRIVRKIQEQGILSEEDANAILIVRIAAGELLKEKNPEKLKNQIGIDSSIQIKEVTADKTDRETLEQVRKLVKEELEIAKSGKERGRKHKGRRRHEEGRRKGRRHGGGKRGREL